MDRTVKTIVFWLVILVSAFLLWQSVSAGKSQSSNSAPEISYSDFLNQVDAGNVAKVTISGSELHGNYRDNREFRVSIPANHEDLLKALRQKNVEIWFRKDTSGSTATWLINFGPIVLIALLWFFMIRKMPRRPNQAAPPGAPQPPDSRWPQT